MASPSFQTRKNSNNDDDDDDDDVVIVSAVRTPLCRARKGALRDVPPSTLLSVVLEGCLERTKNSSSIPPHDVQDVCVGNVLSPASGFVGFRMAQLASGIPHTTPLVTTNRQCSSGLEAVAQIARQIQSQQITIGIGAGVESMSTHPMNQVTPPNVDWERMQQQQCPAAMDCLTPMGVTSENVVKEYGLSRATLDAYAAESHRRAAAARAEGKFHAEIVPVDHVTQDDGIRPDTTREALSKLPPVFDKENGVTTAGNSSQMTDGAAAVLLMTRREAARRGLTVLGVWRGYVVRGVPPRIMGIGPAVAIPAVLEQTGLRKEDVGIFEINEAFASQVTWCIDHLELDPDKVNPNGGAISLGHPLGCTGARQIATLLYEMHRQKVRYGVVSMCVGTGMGAAAVLEVEPRASL